MSDPQPPLRRWHARFSYAFHRTVSVFAIFWLLCWTLSLLAIDGGIVYLLARNVTAASFPSVVGEITVSEPVSPTQTDRWRVEYRYSVNGREFTGQDRSFIDANFSTRQRALLPCAELFVVGRPVTVFYDPNDPSHAALDRTLSGLPLVMAMFLVPFHAVMFYGWNWILRRSLRILSVPVRREEHRWVVMNTNGQPFLVMLIVAGGLSVTTSIIFLINGSEENLTAAATTWCVLIALTIGSYWHTRSLVRQEPPLLIVDNESITWPELAGAPPFSIARKTLLSVELKEQPTNAYELGLVPDYLVCLNFQNETEQSEQRSVLCTSNAARAAALAGWLQQLIAIRSPS